MAFCITTWRTDCGENRLPVSACHSWCWLIITVRNEVAKVMFLHVSVILSTGGGSVSVHAGIPPPPNQGPSPEQTPPWEQTPPPRRLLLRTIHILLECILVCIIKSHSAYFHRDIIERYTWSRLQRVKRCKTKIHSSNMRANCCSGHHYISLMGGLHEADPPSIQIPIVGRQTPLKTLPSLAVGNKLLVVCWCSL